MIVMRIGVLNQRRLAGFFIYGKHRDAVFAAVEHLLALVIRGPVGAIGEVDKLAGRMHMHRAGELAWLDSGAIRQQIMHIGGLRL